MIRELYMTELIVSDWERSVAWYRDILGLRVDVRVEEDQFALLRAGDSRLALRKGKPNPGTVRLSFEVDDLSAERCRLEQVGLAPLKPIEPRSEGYRRLSLNDPDGYWLELFEWRMPSAVCHQDA